MNKWNLELKYNTIYTGTPRNEILRYKYVRMCTRLYEENYKTLRKEIKNKLNNEETFYAYG